MSYCLLYFRQDHCAPCEAAKPAAQAVADATGLPIYWIDVRDDAAMPVSQPDVLKDFQVRSTPTFALARVLEGPTYERVVAWTGNMIKASACATVVLRYLA